MFDHGKSTLYLVFDNLSWAQSRSTPCLVLMMGSVTRTTSKNESHDFEVIAEGTQSEFHFPNSGDPPGTPTDSKKNKHFISFKHF